MAKKLGYTWYPNDWKTSDRVFKLTLSERGLYRELIDLAYQEQNKITYEPVLWSRRLSCTKKEIDRIITKLQNIKNKEGEPLIILKDNVLSIPSCQPRIDLSAKNKKNGSEGDRPNSNPDGNPNDNPNHNPDETQPERQRERERERERESGIPRIVNQFRQPVIPTKNQVWEYFSGQGATVEMAKSFWEKHDGTGWFMNGSPIVSWTSVANRFITNWKSSDYNDQQQSSAPPLKRG